MKTCTKCKIEYPSVRFSADKNRSDGRYPQCKYCRGSYYQRNREWIIAQYAEYRKRPENAAKILRQHKEYAARRFFYITAANLKTRAKSKDEVASIAEISSLWKKQRGTCPITGRRLNRESAQLDHIIPLKKGGSDLVENLRWVHRDVNYAKRDLLDAEFFRLCSDVVSYSKLRD
jgi:5-methylcytosine-specific restriction endonuclease McrA